MNLTVQVDEQLLNDVRNRLGQFSNKAPNAISNALNRAMTNVSSNISKEVRNDYNIKASDIKATLSKIRATRSNLGALVKSKGEPVPLDRFKVNPMTVNPRRKQQLKIAVKKDGTKQILGAFVANINGTKIFKRETKKRLPIKRLFGPSVPQMIGNEQIRQKINQEGYQTFTTRLNHEIDRILQRGAGSS